MWRRHFEKSRHIAIAIYGLVIISYGVEATYSGGIKTRTYTETDPQITTHTYTTHHRTHQYVPVNGEYQYSHSSSQNYDNDKDYQTTITHQSRGSSTGWTPSSNEPDHHFHNHRSSQNYGNDRDYHTTITHQSRGPIGWVSSSYVPSDSSYQQQQRGDNYYHQHHEQQQPSHHQHVQQQPIYQRTYSSSQIQESGKWQDSENAITDYYTGCPTGHTGQLPYAYDCRRFLNCWRGRGHIQSCSVGTVFNPETLECDRPDKVQCGVGLALGAQVGVTHTTAHGQLKQQQPALPNQRAGRFTDTSSDVDILCPSGVQGLQPHPSDCTKFINCANGNVHVQDCGPGTAFSIPMKVCDFKSKVDCTGREILTEATVRQDIVSDDSSKSFKSHEEHIIDEEETDSENIKCPPDAAGLFPHPYDCAKFLLCASGYTYIQNCGRGTGFDSIRSVCDYKEKVQCGSGSTWHTTDTTEPLYTQQTISSSSSSPSSSPSPSPGDRSDLPHNADILCPNGITGIFPYPFDYTKFIYCKNGNTAIQNCVRGTAFSISKGYCESLEQIEKSDHVVYVVSEVSYEYAQTLITCPPGTEGIHLYPFNAEKYVKCIRSQLEVVSCSPSQVFSVTRRVCLPIDQVLKYERVRLLSELQKSDGYRITEDLYDVHTMVYCPFGLTGTYPHPFDNSKYIRCGGGRMIRESCASGKAYSLSRKVCDMKEDIDRNDRVQQTQSSHGQDWHVADIETTYGSIDGLTYLMCPPEVCGYFLHPFDCTKYMECDKGDTKVESCITGAVFSISRKECIPRDKVEAYDRVEYLTTTQHEFSNEHAIQADNNFGVSCGLGTFGIYPHPTDYRLFVRCANGRISVEHCGPGQIFDIDKSYCRSENVRSPDNRGSYTRSQVNEHQAQGHYTGASGLPGTTTTTTATDHNSGAYIPEHKDIECPANANGRFTHPYDCTKFIMCTNGKPHIQSCGPGTAWNKAMEVCDFKDKVDCSPTGTLVSTNQPEILCPAGVGGLYQHPYDWRKYLSCDHGRTHIMDCGPGTVFSVSRKVCDLEANVVNDDRCNNGVYSNAYDYSYMQNSNRDPNGYGTASTHWTHTETHHQPPVHTYSQTHTAQQNAGDRWTNMNVPRPQGSSYDHQSGTWQQSSNTQHTTAFQPTTNTVRSSTAINVDHQSPTQTILFEEGSLQPGRNYNSHTYSTPLAPLVPGTAGTSTSTTVYAQPIGSQEDSEEVFDSPHTHSQPQHPYNNPPHNHQENRQNFTRHIHFTPSGTNWVPVVPTTRFVPSAHVPVTTYLMPPLPAPREEPGLVLTHPNTHLTPPYSSLPGYPIPMSPYGKQHFPTGPHIPQPTTNLMPPTYSNEDRGQRPLKDTGHTVTTIFLDNLPGQSDPFNPQELEPLPSGSRKVHTVHNSNSLGGLQPPLPDIHTTSTQRQLVDKNDQTTQIPQPLETTTPLTLIHGYPKLSNATIQTFPNQPHYSHSYSEVSHSRNASTLGRKIPQHSSIKPTNQGSPTRLENSRKYNEEVSITTAKTNSYGHIPSTSQIVNEKDTGEIDPQSLLMKEALQLLLRPYLNNSDVIDDAVASRAESHIMNLVSSNQRENEETTTTHNPLHPSRISNNSSTTPLQPDVELILAGEQHSLVSTTVSGGHETSTFYDTHDTTVQSERSTTAQSHEHNSNWHKHHRHNHSPSKSHHSREFHEKHPHLPNPFGEAQRTGERCPFDCGNGRCIQHHEVCNGVNNCDNRKDEQSCDHLGYEIRLTGGESSNMGRIEVKILGKWGYVCDDKFGLKDADVVCRELGFKMGAMEVRGSSYYSPTDINISFNMDEVECKGNETSLRECDFKGWGVNNCGPDEVVGVVCKVQKMKCPDNYWLCAKSEECIPTAFLCDVTPDCSDGSDESPAVCNAPIQYRLEGGRSKNEGRLEVFYRGEWGTVCDDDFGPNEAQVVCNSLGFYGKPEVAKNIYGPGHGPIWLDQVSCLGNETSLDKCNHWTWGENNCQHTEDLGLKCTAGPKPVHSNVSSSPTNNKDLKQYELEYEQSELDDLGKYQGLWQRSSKAVHSEKQCGHFKPNLIDEYAHPEERVINGSIAQRGRHPWQATIRTRGRGGISSHWCGAVIISKKLILTAAHCLAGYPKGSYFVRMGDHYANIAEASEVDANIENWYIHEKFRDQKHMNNDIALILLKTPVRFNDYIQPVCLPEKGAHLEANRKCTISGWGSIKSGTSTPSNILRAAEVPILADEVCSRRDVYATAMSEGMFCAGFLDESVDACDGDSGGPLVCNDDGAETLYGIISWGQHCGYANHPGVYVRVEKYIDWIYEKINLMIQHGKL